MTNPIALDLLKLAEHYLSALHGSVARHDNIGLNLSCGGCALRDEIRDVLPKLAAAVSVPPPAPRADVYRADVLRAEADRIVAHCPDHGTADGVWMDCHCAVADDMRRSAGGPCVAGEQQNETPETETQQQPVPGRNFAAYQAAIVRVALVLREAREHREQTDPSERQDCVMCGADHFAEIRDAIKGKQPDIGAWQAEAHLTADDLDELEAHLESTGETIAELNETIVELTQRAARAEAQQQLDIPASTAPLASGPPLVKGNCPACRHASLFLGTGGYPTCSNHECFEPDAATTVLEQYANEAHPPAHTWKVESPRRDKWASWGATYDDREWASERYESAIEHASGRAFRLVRATTTYTVEAEHQPAAARQDAPLVEPCPPGCVACATDESHDPAAGVRQDGAQPE